MAAKIIALLGSPLLQGNTSRLLDRAIQGAQDAGADVEKIEVTTLNFKACREIFYCREHETCAMKDDMTDLYEKITAISMASSSERPS